AFELNLAAASRAADGNARAAALARAVELAGRFMPVTFRTEIPPARLAELLDSAKSAGDPTDPVVAARLALATAWTSVPVSPDLAALAASAAEATGDPGLIAAS